MPAKQKQKPKKDKNNHLDKVIIPWKLSDTQFILCKKVAIFTLLKKKKKKKSRKLPIQCFKVFLLSNLEENLHWKFIIIDLSKPRDVLLHLVPFTIGDTFLKIPHIEVKPRLFL